MEIQDLGAIGEFISSVVVVVMLMFLLFEVRATKRASLQANAQERQRTRNASLRAMRETPMAAVITKANQHLGDTQAEVHAREFGLEPHEYTQLWFHYWGTFVQMRDAYLSDLPETEVEALDGQIRSRFGTPAFAKWYDVLGSLAPDGNFIENFQSHVDQMRAAQR